MQCACAVKSKLHRDIFAKQFTARSLVGSYATLFTTIDFIITVVPILVITWVLFMLFKRIYKKYVVSTIVLILSFSFVWILIGWKLNRDINSKSFKIEYSSFSEMKLNEESGKKEEVKTKINNQCILHKTKLSQ